MRAERRIKLAKSHVRRCIRWQCLISYVSTFGEVAFVGHVGGCRYLGLESYQSGGQTKAPTLCSNRSSGHQSRLHSALYLVLRLRPERAGNNVRCRMTEDPDAGESMSRYVAPRGLTALGFSAWSQHTRIPKAARTIYACPCLAPGPATAKYLRGISVLYLLRPYSLFVNPCALN